jgi:hypothetical protein
MIDPITTSYVASAYLQAQPVQRPQDPVDFRESAKQSQINKALFTYNANLIQASSEIFAEALSLDEDEASSALDVQSDAYQNEAEIYNAYVAYEYRGSHLNLEV